MGEYIARSRKIKQNSTPHKLYDLIGSCIQARHAIYSEKSTFSFENNKLKIAALRIITTYDSAY